MKKFNAKNLIFLFLIISLFPTENFAQTKIGLLPISISFDKKDKRSSKERIAEMKAKVEELKKKKEPISDQEWREKRKEKKENEYEEQFVIMLRKNLIEQLAEEEIDLTEVNVEDMTEEEREGERIFYTNMNRNMMAKVAKDASKRKIKKPKTSALENDEPSFFIQTVTKKYDKEYVIYMRAIGNYEKTHKNKRYRVNNTDLRGPVGSLSVDVIIYEKAKGKLVCFLEHNLGGYSTDSSTGVKSGTFIYDGNFEKFGKKMAKKIKKAIEKQD